MLILSNWKTYVTNKDEAKKLLATVKRLATTSKAELVVLPPHPYIGLFHSPRKTKVGLGAQDVSTTIAGAATGEVPAGVLKNLGVTYVLAGHSERRAKGEDNEVVAEKVRRILEQGMTPILCVGEKERDEDATYLAFLREQITSVFDALDQKERFNVMIAYEPIWAIGKEAQDALHSQELAEMVLYIKKILSKYMPSKQSTKILYGGSAEPDNVRGLAGGSGVDGFLVGHASADPEMFSRLVKALQ